MTPAPGKWGVSPVLGHDYLWDILTQGETPVVMHFLGPEGVGKRKFAREWHWKINGTTATMDYLYLKDPSMDDLASARDFANMPPNYLHRTICVELSDTPPLNVTAALAMLVDDPMQTKFVFVSTFELPETLATRAMTYVFHGLDTSTIATVLQNRGVPAEAAKKFAILSEGSIARALSVRKEAKPREVAMTLVNAIADRSTRDLNKVYRGWTPDVRDALRLWLRESLQGLWRVYSVEDDKPLSRQEKLALLRATSKGSSGRNAVRRAAEEIIRGGTGV